MCKYGAAMGQRSDHVIWNDETPPKFYLQRVQINSGGYQSDDNCIYWGVGTPLYHYFIEDNEVDAFIRASSRIEAKSIIRQRYTNAKFFR